jgi:hypothetical protein
MPSLPLACRMRRLLLSAAGCALLSCALPALADPLKESRQGDYTLVSGGNDEAEVAQLEKLAPRYQIQLLFLRKEDKSGLPGVQVRVRNTAGDLMVETTTRGPWLYVNPPAGGRYTIEAEYDGEVLAKTRDLVGRRYLQLEFQFGAAAAQK